jgi:hypothetical protein
MLKSDVIELKYVLHPVLEDLENIFKKITKLERREMHPDESRYRKFRARALKRGCLLLQRALWPSTSYWLNCKWPGTTTTHPKVFLFNSTRTHAALGMYVGCWWTGSTNFDFQYNSCFYRFREASFLLYPRLWSSKVVPENPIWEEFQCGFYVGNGCRDIAAEDEHRRLPWIREISSR